MLLLSLHTLIERRREFQQLYAFKRYGKRVEELTPGEKNLIMKDMVLASVGELMEFLEKATNWKEHRPTHIIDRTSALEEYVDSFNYLLTPFIYMDISVEEFWTAFLRKDQIIRERFASEFPQVLEEMNHGTAS